MTSKEPPSVGDILVLFGMLILVGALLGGGWALTHEFTRNVTLGWICGGAGLGGMAAFMLLIYGYGE